MTSTSSQQLHSHTDQNTVFQTNKHTKKGNPKGSGLKKKKKFCSSSAKAKTEKLCSSTTTTGDLEAI